GAGAPSLHAALPIWRKLDVVPGMRHGAGSLARFARHQRVEVDDDDDDAEPDFEEESDCADDCRQRSRSLPRSRARTPRRHRLPRSEEDTAELPSLAN